ncbi:hypothetical protein Bca52824_029387 [Brassica carinata]|uniref:Uncharacterized protein n=1 Tax=Brassica carinata TaxID=52824 RepID=A0A8X8APG7_BRACI|nr:hypothetical protein Bca52824_029387 [Brassica carinata]
MRCKRHTVDSTSTIGVCASCLRERLFSLPYAAARNSDAGGGREDSLGSSSSSEQVFETNRSFKKKQTGLSRFSTFFTTRSNELSSRDSSTFSPSSSSSWFSKVLSPRSKKQTANTTTCYIEDLIVSESNQQQRPRHSYCKGLSPANELESSVEESPGRARRTSTPGRKKTAKKMALCLSPLVRAKPNCSFGYTGEMKSPVRPHISTAASYCANRSKKLADLGRADHRR